MNQYPTSTACLESPGGPLHVSPVSDCDFCTKPIAEGGYFALGDDVLCGRCAVQQAFEVLIDCDPLRAPDAVERQAIDILSQFLHEQKRRGT